MPTSEPNPTAFRDIRHMAKLTVSELAELAGIGRNTLWRIETGKATPTEKTVFKVAAALKVPAHAFYKAAA